MQQQPCFLTHMANQDLGSWSSAKLSLTNTLNGLLVCWPSLQPQPLHLQPTLAKTVSKTGVSRQHHGE